MYCWLLLQIYLCYLWLLLCSRDTYYVSYNLFLTFSLLGLKNIRPAESLDEWRWVGDAPCICRAWCRSGRSCEPWASASGRSSCSTGGTDTPGCWCESERAASCWPAAWTHGHRCDTCAPSLPKRWGWTVHEKPHQTGLIDQIYSYAFSRRLDCI